MASSYFYLLLFLFAAACKITTAVSTTASSGCSTEIGILGKDEVRQQLESHLQNDMDIVEIHIHPNTSISIITDNGAITNETFVSASITEKYNMFVYFIVTDTGKTILKYPVDADTLSFGALGSHKVLMDIDIYVVNPECALNTEQFRNLFVNYFLTVAPLLNNSDISVCYFSIPIFNVLSSSKFLFVPYYTYNTFSTFCLTDGMAHALPQASSNKFLWALCIFLSLTMPLMFYFIPHSVHKETETYHQHDVPFSFPLLWSYIEYWKPLKDNCCYCCCYYFCCCYRPFLVEDVLLNPRRRGFIFVALISFLFGHSIQYMVDKNQPLENELMILSGSTILWSYSILLELSFLVYLIPLAFLFSRWGKRSDVDITNAKYSILVIRKSDETTRNNLDETTLNNSDETTTNEICSCCININELNLSLEETGVLLYSKMVSETLLSLTFWRKVWNRSKICRPILFPVNCLIVIIMSIPVINETVTLIRAEVFKLKTINILFCCQWLVLRLMAINILFMQTATLMLQVIILSIFVTIPIYPKRLAYIVLIIGIFKFILQTVMQFQKKAQRVLTYTFEELEEQGHPKSELLKQDFSNVLKHCPSVNECGVLMKLIAFSFVSFTAYTAINQGDKAAMVWNDIIPPIIIFLGPDMFSKFFYNEEADNYYIKECVKEKVSEMIESNTLETLNPERRSLLGNASGEYAPMCQVCN